MSDSQFDPFGGLGRVPQFDPRSRQFPARALTGPVGAVRRRRVTWSPGPVLDQGREGACVGFGVTHELLASPVRVDLSRASLPSGWAADPDTFARQVYRAAQRIDPWEGESYEGTSVLAGVKTAQQLGLVREYRWAFSIEELRAALLTLGPVVVGTWWRSGMYRPVGGQLRVVGEKVGGHCWLVIGYEPEMVLGGQPPQPMYLAQNSWGPGWGLGGCAWITEADLAGLLADEGEACVLVGRRYGRLRVLAARAAAAARSAGGR